MSICPSRAGAEYRDELARLDGESGIDQGRYRAYRSAVSTSDAAWPDDLAGRGIADDVGAGDAGRVVRPRLADGTNC